MPSKEGTAGSVVQGMLVTLGDEGTGQNPECEGENIALNNKYKKEPQVRTLIPSSGNVQPLTG